MKRIFRRGDDRKDVGDELRFHLDMRTQEFIDAGLSPDDARRAAARSFGDVDAIDAQLRVARALRTRERVRRDRIQEFTSDVAFALRTLRKNLGFTVAALATLALGIGAATAVFTVVDGVLLRPLPYTDPSRLQMIWMSGTRWGNEMPLSAGFYHQIRDHRAFTAIAGFRAWNYDVTSGGEVERVAGARITPSLFGVLGAQPMLGRAFVASDAEEGASNVVVISHALWQRRFGGDANIVNRRIELGSASFTIVGVMPEDFGFPRGAELPPGLQFGQRTELWTPLTFTDRDRRNYGTANMAAIGRLKPGATQVQAHGELSSVLKTFLRENAPTLELDYRLVDLQEQAGQHVRGALYFLLGAVVFLLVIACANVANLLIARTATRRREFAVRAALGAGRARIARQLVTENIVLAIVGTAAGLALSIRATRAMLALVPGSMPRADDVRVDWRVALAVGVVAIVIGATFGLAASMQVRWGHLAATLHDADGRSTGGRGRGISRRMLVAAEVSLSLMLIIGAGLLTASFLRLQRVEPGFNPHNAVSGSVALPFTGGFNPGVDGPEWARFFRQLGENLSRAPGVEAVGSISVLPLTSTAEGGSVAIVGQPEPKSGQAPHANYLVVEGNIFRALGVSLLAGRTFEPSDGPTTTPVAIVNREFARRYLGGRGLDAQVRTFFDFSNGATRTIVGVVENVGFASLDAAPYPQIYVPEQQMSYPALNIVIRTPTDPTAMLATLKREVKAMDSRLAVARAQTLDHVFDESLARRRFNMTLIGIFAVSALVLAMVGLYGVIALSVNQRRREIGVRIALGARPGDVLRLVLGEGLRITAAGVAIGLLGAVLLSRLAASLLFGVSATSAAIYAAATVAIVIVTLLASYLPARRATRVDPTTALRSEG
jgi:predicted permease